jgi:Fic family protein
VSYATWRTTCAIATTSITASSPCSRALRHPDERLAIQQHQRTSGVVYQTARTDLLGLAENGFLQRRKVGHAYVFVVPRDLERRLARR